MTKIALLLSAVLMTACGPSVVMAVEEVASHTHQSPKQVWHNLAKVIAKKMYHRGDRITARDLFDFALVTVVGDFLDEL